MTPFKQRNTLKLLAAVAVALPLLGCVGAVPEDNLAETASAGAGDLGDVEQSSAFYPEWKPPIWSRWFSDGSPADAECAGADVVAGAVCNGRYCDNMRILCKNTPYSHSSSAWSPWFSDNSSYVCPGNQVVTGMRCSGDYCDNLQVKCTTLSNNYRTNCRWTGNLSEEGYDDKDSQKWVAPDSMYVAGVKCEGDYCDNVSFYVCGIDTNPWPTYDIPTLASRHAPLLRFDQGFGVASGDDSKCFPSSAQAFYQRYPSGTTTKSYDLCNINYSTLQTNQVPAYYVARQVSPHMILITYWIFYAWQSNCALGSFGGHMADWERITAVIDRGALRAVLYHQHNGYYARLPGSFETFEGTHPVAYIGKNAHGSYHSSGGIGGCLYWDDFRNPSSNDYRMYTWNNLKNIDARQESWMGDTNYRFGTIDHPLNQTGEYNDWAGCRNDGCEQTQLSGRFPLLDDPRDIDYVPMRIRHSGKCADVYGLTSADGANLVQWTCTGGANQLFSFQSDSSGNLEIRSRLSNKCLDVVGGSTADGTRIAQWSCNGGSNQKFWLDFQGLDGQWRVRSVSSQKCMDVSGISYSDGAQIYQWSCLAGDNQKFRFY